LIRSRLLGIRESFGQIIFDPVLALGLDGMVASTTLCGRPVELHFRVRTGEFGPGSVTVNGVLLSDGKREANPYRTGGLSFAAGLVAQHLLQARNVIVVEL
jgi:CRISPR-associated protein Csx3